MSLKEFFDAVLMFTWSDWKGEPRSNRYHYATRFARVLPVLFFQHNYEKTGDVRPEPTEIKNIDVVNISCALTSEDIGIVKQLLAARGIRRPLIWIYDPVHYAALIAALPMGFRVFHATEDYLVETEQLGRGFEPVRKALRQLLGSIDFLVACSQGVARSYISSGGYSGPQIVSENGCDVEYLFDQASRHVAAKDAAKAPVAVFQGGINQRLDYDLLLEVVKRMPEWEFQFCGSVVDSHGWSQLLRQKNVRYLGVLHPDDVAQRMCEATVGIIPFIQDQWIRNSLPLKAYEYVACGLPVVTVPITSLERDSDLMTVAASASEFEAAIRRAAEVRHDAASLEKRRRAALANSYDKRFLEVSKALVSAKEALIRSGKRLRIAMLYDGVGSMHVSTIKEHLESFRKYSTHEYLFIPATASYWQQSPEEVESAVDFGIFDAVFIHYSIRISITDHFEEGLARALEKFNGLKALFIQDEYEGTEKARAWMDRIGFDLVYTCVPQESLRLVYPGYRFPATEFLPTLTGYVPEVDSIERFAKPLSERKLLIAYRGRKLPAIYGEMGYEKYRIGVEMKAIAGMRGLPVDIEVDDSQRIYGAAWYEFLGSARATLGTESGANVFDFDGSLGQAVKRLETGNPGITFEEIFAKVLAPHEGRVAMNQISPETFEAIRLRTALVLFDGNYSGVVERDKHFIPLRKDFSNVDEVLEKLQDDVYLKEMTERAYRDVVASGKYSYERFVAGVDSDIETRVLHINSYKPLAAPLIFIDSNDSTMQPQRTRLCFAFHSPETDDSGGSLLSLKRTGGVINTILLEQRRVSRSAAPSVLEGYGKQMERTARALRTKVLRFLKRQSLLMRIRACILRVLPADLRIQLSKLFGRAKNW